MSDNKKKFVVDVHWDYARAYEVEAKSPDDAVAKVEDMMSVPDFDPVENGFEKTECEVLFSADANYDVLRSETANEQA